jgi:hypothetical protein
VITLKKFVISLQGKWQIVLNVKSAEFQSASDHFGSPIISKEKDQNFTNSRPSNSQLDRRFLQ